MSEPSSLVRQVGPPVDLIFIKAGQSNAQAVNLAKPGDNCADDYDSRIYELDQNGKVVPLSFPMKDYITFKTSTSMGATAARSILASLPLGSRILFVPCAFGGSQFNPPQVDWRGGKYCWSVHFQPTGPYDRNLAWDMVRRVKLAQREWPLATVEGLFWHQGESSVSDPNILQEYVDLIQYVRTALNDEKLPVVMGTLRKQWRESVPEPGRSLTTNRMNGILKQLPDIIQYKRGGSTSFVTTVDLDGLDDVDEYQDNLHVHFSAVSQRKMGFLYAFAYKCLKSQKDAEVHKRDAVRELESTQSHDGKSRSLKDLQLEWQPPALSMESEYALNHYRNVDVEPGCTGVRRSLSSPTDTEALSEEMLNLLIAEHQCLQRHYSELLEQRIQLKQK